LRPILFGRAVAETKNVSRRRAIMGSTIAGWILFGVGILIYLVSIWARIQKLTKRREEAIDLASIEDTAKAVAKLVEAFSKFSEDMQFLLLGSGCLVAGLYLLQNKPF
jgi:hypothetical protein